MTAKRDLKRLVRERQERTGESYVTARRNVVAQGKPAEPPPPPPAEVIPVVEMISLTDEAAKLGMKCRVTIASTLAQVVDPIVALTRVRDALLATDDDPATRVLRGVVFRGEPFAGVKRTAVAWGEIRRFVARALAGIGGVSEAGNMLALPVDGKAGAVMVIVHVGFRPVTNPAPRVARLVLSAGDFVTTKVLALFAM